MRILYIGDIHGRIEDLNKMVDLSTDVETAYVQVGDLGFGFPNKTIKMWLEERANKIAKGQTLFPFYSCLGNHDNYDMIYELWENQNKNDLVELFPNSNAFYVHRGSLINIFGISHLFLGGAESTDKFHRTEGVSWWNREEASQEEFQRFFDNFEQLKPNTIVSHDVPLRVDLYRSRRNQSLTPNMLENVYKMSSHRPRRHYFGHHHLLDQWKVDGTKFYCCGLGGEYYERVAENE